MIKLYCDRPETNQKPWEITLKELKEGNKRVKWMDRLPYAYWKGNPDVTPIRADLKKCNLNYTSNVDWNTRLFFQVITIFCYFYILDASRLYGDIATRLVLTRNIHKKIHL